MVLAFDDLVALVQGLLPKLEVEIIPGKPPRSSKQPMVITRASEVLGREPEYSVEAGFRDYIEGPEVGGNPLKGRVPTPAGPCLTLTMPLRVIL